MATVLPNDDTRRPPFETEDLRRLLTEFLDTPFVGSDGASMPVGHYRWGVYAFFDYDGEPIYVGQTNEMLRTRVRRHLTNQRTDAVAMSVLDPFEVHDIEVWPLADLQDIYSKNPQTRHLMGAAKAELDALERQVTRLAVAKSTFKAILNEKDPPPGDFETEIPPSFRGSIVSDAVARLRGHPDFRIARRALIISRLAQVISERKVQGGLRRVLQTQARRLQSLAARRYEGLGGAASVLAEGEDDEA